MAASNDKYDDLFLEMLERDDPRAYLLLYRVHFKAVYNYVRKFVEDPDDAKDIVQELFAAIFEKRATLNISRPVRRYLFSAAYNRTLNFKRQASIRKRNAGKASTALKQNYELPPDAGIEAGELHDLIKLAIKLLPDKVRMTFALSRRIGMTYKEIASYLKVTEKAVEKNMTKGLRLLRVMLKGYMG